MNLFGNFTVATIASQFSYLLPIYSQFRICIHITSSVIFTLYLLVISSIVPGYSDANSFLGKLISFFFSDLISALKFQLTELVFSFLFFSNIHKSNVCAHSIANNNFSFLNESSKVKWWKSTFFKHQKISRK